MNRFGLGLGTWALVLAIGASPTTRASDPSDVAAVDSARRVDLEARIRRRFVPSYEGGPGLAVVFSGAPPRMPASWTIDVASGDGHGAALTFRRFERTRTSVRVEEVAWTGRSLTRSEGEAHALRAELTDAECAPLVDLVRLLPTVELREVPPARRADGRRVGGAWSSSHDFLALVRVIDPDRGVVLDRSFCGYAGSSQQLDYLAVRAVVEFSRELLAEKARFTDLRQDELRGTHFPSAFERNEELVLRDFSWWVLEYSVEALGTFGTPAALPALEALRARATRLLPRRRRKIDTILGDPDHWLAGPPKLLE